MLVVLGIGDPDSDGLLGGSGLALGYLFGALLVFAGAFRLYLSREAAWRGSCPGLQRVLDAPSLAAVAYGEIASSHLLRARRRRALRARLHPLGAAARRPALPARRALVRRGDGGDAGDRAARATFVRRAFNDHAGFLTGWVLFLDYLIVIALAALFVPHYLGHAVGWDWLTDSPWDIVVGIGVIVGDRRRAARPPARASTGVRSRSLRSTLAAQLLLIVLGLPLLFSLDDLTTGTDLGTAPTWSSIAFALPLAMLAYTGLETVANLAAETREPGRTLPRSLFVGIGAVGRDLVPDRDRRALGVPGASRPRRPGGCASDLGTEWLRAPLVGIAAAFGGELPAPVVDALRVFVGVTRRARSSSRS